MASMQPFRHLAPNTSRSPFRPKLAVEQRARKRRGAQMIVGSVRGMEPREVFDTGRTGRTYTIETEKET